MNHKQAKQLYERTTAESSISAFANAINAIPLHTPRERLKAAVGLLLHVLIEENNSPRGWAHTQMHVTTDLARLDFAPPALSHPWETDVVDTYGNAVAKNQPWTDVFARVQEQNYDGTSKRWGQHFTPQPLVDALIRFTAPVPEPNGDGVGIKVGDPTCGFGGMLLGAARREQQSLRLDSNTYIGNDIDPLCVGICALQFLANVFWHRMPIGAGMFIQSDVIKEYLAGNRPSIIIHPTQEPAANDD